jgi:hypothetical protein
MQSRLGSLSSLSLGSVNLALLSFYFFPVWGRDAIRALTSPYNGLNDRVHATATIYFCQWFDLSFNGLVIASHILAGVKLVIAVGFVAYIIEFIRSWAIERQPDRETVDVVLILAILGIILHAVPALALGEPAMVRLYATQMLLIAGAITVIIVERHLALEPQSETSRIAAAASEREASGLGLSVGVLAAGPPSAQTSVALARIPEERLRSR